MEKVVVAMSGGIDSSVAAFLLKKEGYDVIGVSLKFFSENESIKCCGSSDSIEKFKRICNHIGIRYYVKNAVELFEKSVVKKFALDYVKGFTPNPCVQCNRVLKFDYLMKIAKSLGASKLATGHYAIVEKDNNKYIFKRGIDDNKDQSYFLYSIEKENLKDIVFPLGYMTKNEVKSIAKENNIPVNLDKESKDICFIPQGNYSMWLKKNGYVKDFQGYFKDINGKIIGTHNGYYRYTIGQRKGLGVCRGKKLYVVKIDANKNEVILGDIKDAFYHTVIAGDINWLVDKRPMEGQKIIAQIRYRHTPGSGIIKYKDDNKIEFVFDEKQFALTPGQSIVFYNRDRVLGGGVIKEVI